MTMDASEHPAEWHDLINAYRKQGAGAPPLKMVLTVTFEEQARQTKLTIRTRFESPADRDATVKMGAAAGWSQRLKRLEEHMALARAT